MVTDRALIADALKGVESAVLVLQSLAQVARLPPVFAPSLLQHSDHSVGGCVLASQVLGAIQHRACARIVAGHVEPGQAHERGHVLLEGLRVA